MLPTLGDYIGVLTVRNRQKQTETRRITEINVPNVPIPGLYPRVLMVGTELDFPVGKV